MAYADALRSDTWTASDVATLIEGIFASTYPATWTTWSPTITLAGGSPTLISPVFEYSRCGKVCVWVADFGITMGASNSQYIKVSAPATVLSVGGGGGSNRSAGRPLIWYPMGSQIEIYNYELADFVAANTYYLRLGGVLRCA